MKRNTYVIATLSFLAALAAPRSASAFVVGQTGGGSTTAQKNTSAATWAATTTAGSLLLANLVVTDYSGTPTAPSGWVLAGSNRVTTVLNQFVYYMANAPARSGAETFTLSTTTGFDYSMNLVEYQGVDWTVTAGDTATFATTTATAATSVSVTSAAATPYDSSLVICAVANDHGRTMSKATGFTKDDQDRTSGTANPGGAVEHIIETAVATPTATWTFASADVAAVLLTFHGARKFWSSTSSTTFATVANWKMSNGAVAPTVPADGDLVYFDGASSNVSSIMTADLSIADLFLQNGYTGTVTMQAPTTGTNPNTLTVTGTTTISAGTLKADRNGTTTNRLGALAFTGDVTQSGGTVDMGSGTITAAGDYDISGGALNATCATPCTGANQGLTISGGLAVTGGAVATVGGEFDVSGAVTISAGSFTHSANTTVVPSSTWNSLALSGTGAVSIASGTSVTITNATTIAGTATLQGPGAATFSSTLGMTGGTVTTAGGTFALNGNVTISAGTYTSSSTSTSTIATGKTLALSGTGAVSVSGGTFDPKGGVTLAGTSTYTAASGTTNTFGSTLDVGGTSTFDLASGSMTVAGAMTVSGGSFKGGGTATLSSTLGVSAGTYDANGGSSTVTGLVTLSGGTYKLGSSATGQTLSAGLTISGGTLDGSSSTGVLKIAAGKTLSMSSGTLQTSTGTIAGPTFSSTTTSTYSFSITGGTVNVDGLAVTGVNNSPGVSITGTTTLTRLDDVNFANIPATNPGSTSYLLTINVASLDLSTTGDKFDYNTTTFSNLKTVHLTDSGGTVGDVRVYFQDQSAALNGAAAGDAADADEDTAPDDGVGDTGNHAVAYWSYAVATDTAGAIQGYPTAAIDWNTFTFYSVYVAYNNVDGGGTGRIYVRDSNGNAKSTTDIPSAAGTIVGTPYWDTEGTSTHVLYVATSLGRIYKYVDTSGTLALASSPWSTFFADATNVKAITSPLISDETNLYFGGTNASSANTIFGVSISGAAVVKHVAAAAAITAAPSWLKSSGITYLYVGSAAAASQAYMYRVNVSPGATIDATCLDATASILGATRLLYAPTYTYVLYAGDGNAKLHAISAVNFTSGAFKNITGFPYQDTANHSPVTLGAITGAPVVDPTIGRIMFGDADGHLYELTTAGALVTGYPKKLGSNAITTSPAYVTNSGVIVVGDSAGNVYYVDQKNASSVPNVFYTMALNGSVSSIAYDSGSGQYMVGTSTGQLELLPAKADPTPTFTY